VLFRSDTSQTVLKLFQVQLTYDLFQFIGTFSVDQLRFSASSISPSVRHRSIDY